MNMMERGIAWQNQQEQLHTGVDLVYTQQGTPIPLVATPIRLRGSEETMEANQFLVPMMDFIISADQLPDPPRKGDTVRYRGKTYELMLQPGEGWYRNADPYGIRYRVHTQEIGDSNGSL